jgi:TrmH family RNA methyltransferase
MGQPEIVTSAHNPLLRDIRKAAGRGAMTSDGFWLAEGFHLLEEALASRCEIQCIVAAERHRLRASTLWADSQQARLVILPDLLFDSISSVEAAQGLLSLVRPRPFSWHHLLRATPLILVLDQIQDPGNAGTILRSAEAFGATGVIFLKGSVHPWNPKTIRASAGSLFRVPHVTLTEPAEALQTLTENSIALLATLPHGGTPLDDVRFTQPCAIVVGNEGAGIRPEFLPASTPISIMTARVESLNAGIAASLVLYEAARQRRTA